MPELIRLNIPFILMMLLAALSFAVIYTFYRRTNPEIASSWKWILILLRSAVLFLLVLLFFEPTVHVFYYQKKYPTIDVFFDNSQSMSVREGNESRWEQVEEVKQILNKNLPKSARVRWFVFNSRVQALPDVDSLKPSRAGTNFIPVLKRLTRDAPDLAFIISDGVITEGGLPTNAEFAARTTLFAVPIGKVHAESDAFVQDAEFAPVAYKGQRQTVSAIIGTRQWKKKETALVTLASDNKILAQQNVLLVPGATSKRVVFSYVPGRVGLQRLTIRISGLKDDANDHNNVFRFVQNVLKSRINVALFAAAPNYDVKFMRLLLRDNPRFALHWYVEDNQGRFLGHANFAALDSSDVWVFAPFPGQRSTPATIRRLREVWKRRHPSLALLADKDVSWAALKRLTGNVPFRVALSFKKEKQVSVIPDENEKTNAFLTLFADRSLNQLFWSRIPPITNYYHRLVFNAPYTDLLAASYNGTLFPMVFLQELPGYKLLVFNGMGFWKWHFLMQSDPEMASGYRIFLEKLMRWLASRQPFKPVLLSANQTSGYIGQTFDLTVRLVDARFKPVANGSVLVQAQLDKQRFNLSAQEVAPGLFKARFIPPTAGTYRLRVQGFQQDTRLGSDSLVIAVVPVDKEFIHLSPDTLLLSRLSAASGGKLLHARQLVSFLKTRLNRPRKVLKEKRLELWYRPAWLILIILLISLEWALRKKLNLV